MPALVTSLDSTVLALRLRELAGEERNVQVDFLIHLDEFDRRRAFAEAGHPSLWSYCLEVLPLREGAAGRRIQAMKVLRRLPKLEGALRDGRLCISTMALLGQVLTEENQDDLLARAAYRTKADVDHLVASVQARSAPRAGVRKLPEREPAMTGAPLPLAPVEAQPEAVNQAGQTPPEPAASIVDRATASEIPSPESAWGKPKRPPERRAVTESQWSLRVTIDRGCNEDLETLEALLAHKIPTATSRRCSTRRSAAGSRSLRSPRAPRHPGRRRGEPGTPALRLGSLVRPSRAPLAPTPSMPSHAERSGPHPFVSVRAGAVPSGVVMNGERDARGLPR